MRLQRNHLTRAAIAAICALVGVSCEQFEYSSPVPGILEVRLAVKNTRDRLLPFGGTDTTAQFTSSFALTLKKLEIMRPGGVGGDIRQELFATIHAIRRNTDGDNFNTLSTSARDSQLVFGAGYVPPGEFNRIEMTINPDAVVVVDFGEYFDVVFVDELPPYQSLYVLPRADEALSIPIEEGKRTVVVVTFDMDQSLIRRPSDRYYYVPVFYVSSINVY
jgi:hypothetical protein